MWQALVKVNIYVPVVSNPAQRNAPSGTCRRLLGAACLWNCSIICVISVDPSLGVGRMVKSMEISVEHDAQYMYVHGRHRMTGTDHTTSLGQK